MSDKKQAVEKLREAIQECERFGMVYDSSGQVVTGVIVCENGDIQIVKS